MAQDPIIAQIQQILCETLKKESLTIDEHTTSSEVEGWDSLNHMIIIAQIERHFGITFNFREVLKFKNIGDLRQTILAKKE